MNLIMCVYRDILEKHDEDDNLEWISVPYDVMKYYFETQKILQGKYSSFEDFIVSYTADDTIDLVDYMYEHNVLIRRV